jgi:four helix bundle protein
LSERIVKQWNNKLSEDPHTSAITGETGGPVYFKDSQMRLRICLKESRESYYWLELLESSIDSKQKTEAQGLLSEADELVRIFAAIVRLRER